MSQYNWSNQWRLLNLQEESFLVKHVMEREPKWIKFIRKKVPDRLQSTLEAAFGKAFATVFEKGTGIIEKTYSKKKHIDMFKENRRVLREKDLNPRTIKGFERHARRAVFKNLVICTVESIAFGLFGLGIPDIPVFVSVMLKSIYEIALSYGFTYKSDKEKLFILLLVETALNNADVLKEKNELVDELIDHYREMEEALAADSDSANAGCDGREDYDGVLDIKLTRQLERTSLALSNKLLYGKVIQGKAVIGIIGGFEDFICLKRITEYALLKYKRRFLLRLSEYVD